jgi:ABC-type lipoprotein export system ATPase subunit
MTDAIAIRGLIKIHPSGGGPVAALRGVDLHVERGEIVAIVGPSGSGKSTLLRLIGGLERPSAGSLTVMGLDLVTATERAVATHRRRTVGIVEQHYRQALSPYLRVAEAVGLPLALRGVREADVQARVTELLDRIGLKARADADRQQLSGGEQQRVAFAVAMASRPQLLLADEPTGELDRDTAERVLEIAGALVRAEGATAVIVTHDPLVERFADRVVHLADGRIVAERPGPGARTHRTLDSQGWLAPELASPVLVPTASPRTGSADAAVVLDGVARRYRAGSHHVLGLPRLTVSFRRGGFHVITGPSGTGKTTLLRLVVGLDRPTEGRVTTLGHDMATLDREASARFRADRIGIVDQARDLIPFLTTLENVELGLAIRGRDGPGARERAMASLGRFGMADHAEREPGGLSAGERLRVALARAMVGEPELLILDEPTAALDRRAAAAVAELLGGLEDDRVTVLATTHDTALIEAASDRFDLRAAAAADLAARLAPAG